MKNDKLSKSDAIKEFKRLFREKTGNEWEAWENKTDFHKQPNKFYPLEIVSSICSKLNVTMMNTSLKHNNLIIAFDTYLIIAHFVHVY